MNRFTTARRWTIGLTVVALAGLAAAPAGLSAADHLDAPGNISVGWDNFTDATVGIPGGDPRLDITDVYAWSSASSTVLVMNVNPAAGLLTPTTLRPGAAYEFAVDTDGDFIEDLVYEVKAGADNKNVKLKRIEAGGEASVIAKGRGEQSVPVDGGGWLFLGLRDDPFFFDLVGFLDSIADGTSGDGDEAGFGDARDTEGTNDFFTGLDVTSIVLEIPSSDFGGGTVNVWARTVLDGDQVDRMGKPALNTVFIKGAKKNTYNQADPVDDLANFGGHVSGFLELFYDPGTAAFITGLLLPDVLTLDTTDSGGFVPGLNGRQLHEDVIDFELAVVTNGAITSDAVDVTDDPAHNGGAFLGTFPYLSEPNG